MNSVVPSVSSLLSRLPACTQGGPLDDVRLRRAEPASLTEFGHVLETFVVNEVRKQCGWQDESVDVWHCHDWQAALIPVYLKLLFAKHPLHSGAASVFTIHNLAYQGLFWHWDWPVLNLPWKHYNWKEMEFHGKMNLLKGALVHADLLTTVSPTYAKEIQGLELGCGLDGVLRDRTDDLTGIVNGIDPNDWNPNRPYHASDLRRARGYWPSLRHLVLAVHDGHHNDHRRQQLRDCRSNHLRRQPCQRGHLQWLHHGLYSGSTGRMGAGIGQPGCDLHISIGHCAEFGRRHLVWITERA